ncbi:MAG: alpha/beta hydrolase, partial [Pseudomonadota bacterium]
MLRRTLAVILTIVAVLAAGWLALRRADIPYDTLETIYAVRDTQFITLNNGLKIHYTDTGPHDRSAIVLVHGFSASLHTWEAWKTDLEQDYRVITLDLPGHGLSRAEDPEQATIERFTQVVHDVTEDLGVDRFTLAGNSMGGNTAWSFALAYPEKLDGLILVNASGWPETDAESDSDPFIFRLLANPLARTVMKDLDMTSLTRSGLEDSYTDPSFVTDELVERYVALSRAPGHRATLLAIVAGKRVEATAETMAQINMPTLVMWGRDDNLIPVSSATKFAETIPGANLIIYDNVGHLPQEEVAAQSVEDVRAFMLEVEFQTLEEETILPAGDPRMGQTEEAASG